MSVLIGRLCVLIKIRVARLEVEKMAAVLKCMACAVLMRSIAVLKGMYAAPVVTRSA